MCDVILNVLIEFTHDIIWLKNQLIILPLVKFMWHNSEEIIMFDVIGKIYEE